MSKRKRRFFSAEFKAEAVELVKRTGKTIPVVAQELDLTETTLREWVHRAEAPTAARSNGLCAPEREELQALRKEVRTLRMERDFLKKAAAFFAKESK
jgi:transposase